MMPNQHSKLMCLKSIQQTRLRGFIASIADEVLSLTDADVKGIARIREQATKAIKAGDHNAD